jgi:hypothetical protein
MSLAAKSAAQAKANIAARKEEQKKAQQFKSQEIAKTITKAR